MTSANQTGSSTVAQRSNRRTATAGTRQCTLLWLSTPTVT